MMGFLDEFMGNHDQLKQRMATMDTFGQPMDNEANDVPLYDEYNTGLALTQQDMSDRVNLSIDPRAQPRCGLTGLIPSAEINSTGSTTATSSARSGHGSTVSGGTGTSDGSTKETESWFEPVEKEISDCPGVYAQSPGQKLKMNWLQG